MKKVARGKENEINGDGSSDSNLTAETTRTTGTDEKIEMRSFNVLKQRLLDALKRKKKKEKRTKTR